MNPASELLKNLCRLIFIAVVLIILTCGFSAVPWSWVFTAFGLVLMVVGMLACAIQPGLAIGLLLVSILGVVLIFLGGHFTWAFELLEKIPENCCVITGLCIGAGVGLFLAAQKKN